jgi:hypothetical protein
VNQKLKKQFQYYSKLEGNNGIPKKINYAKEAKKIRDQKAKQLHEGSMSFE